MKVSSGCTHQASRLMVWPKPRGWRGITRWVNYASLPIANIAMIANIANIANIEVPNQDAP